MKNNAINKITGLMFLGLSCLFSSCAYDAIRDADYPDQKIYMPSAYGVVYDVSDVSELPAEHPGSGGPYRFQTDEASGEFIIPLGVYRAGVDKEGALTVTITANTDTVDVLIDENIFAPYSNGSNVELLPQAEYSFPESLSIADEEDHESFFLIVNLEFLRANNSTSYAVGITISGNKTEVSPDLNTTVVFIPAGIAD